jgi:hypothetical protein
MLNFTKYLKTKNKIYIDNMNNNWKFYKFYYKTLNYILNNMQLQNSAIKSLIKNGPLDVNGINELSDFIIPPKDVLENKVPFVDWVTSNAGKELKIKIYSLKTRSLKELTIKANEKNSKDGILGGSVRYENWSIAHKKVLHVLNIEENSFAQKIGIIQDKDYIIAVRPSGHQILSLNIEDKDPLFVLGAIINKCKGIECEFFIYNIEKGNKVVKGLIEKDDEFHLGIDGAYGALHEFPLTINNEVIINKDEKEDLNKKSEYVIGEDVKNGLQNI